MATLTRRRVATQVRRPEPELWLEAAPARRPFPVFELVFGLAALLCLAWWVASPEVLVGSGWRENGRVLSCQYLSGTRVVERQYLGTGRGSGGHACPILKFG